MITHKASPLHVDSGNLTLAWGAVLLRLLSPGTTAITPLTLSITGFSSDGATEEILPIRHRLDQLLKDNNIETDIENVAFTIFPEEYWQLADKNLKDFFSLYRESFTRIQDWNPRNNARGSYFQRLVDYQGANKGRNQLEWIISEFKRRPSQRASQYQATTYDPYRDQSKTALLEFPCLQQVSFVPLDDGSLIMNAFYATQQILRKGYGNYLGLCRLGAFMAGQMDLRFTRLNVFVGVAQMDTLKKSDESLVNLATEIRNALGAADLKTHAA